MFGDQHADIALCKTLSRIWKRSGQSLFTITPIKVNRPMREKLHHLFHANCRCFEKRYFVISRR
jgi:hypothetical protein